MKKIYFLFTFAILLSITKLQAQTYYSEDFEAGQGAWQFIDVNEDNKNWEVLNASGIDPSLGSKSIISFSYRNNAPIHADNLAISPAISLTGITGDNLALEYQYYTNPSYPQDKYSVYITNTDDPDAILASTPVLTIVPTGGLKSNSIDITSYIGQTIYISFRHYDSFDKLYLVIDNLEIRTVRPNDVLVQSVSTKRFVMPGDNNNITYKIKNRGNNQISTLKVKWSDGVDEHVADIANVNLNPGATKVLTHPFPANYSDVRQADIELSILNVNEAIDPEQADNNGTTVMNTVSQNATGKVLIEEGTGTWCGWCPRGMIGMASAEQNFPDQFVGVAVHNADPMTVTDYDNGADFSGFPGMNVDRVTLGADPSVNGIASAINNRMNAIHAGTIQLNATVTGHELTVEATGTLYSNFHDADIRMAAILVQDEVKGTGSGYNQVNYYANGANGPMGGFESLPNPVPASQMVYNHVGRALMGGYEGQVGSIPETIADGQPFSYTFNYTIPNEYFGNHLKVVVLLIDNYTGQVINVNKTELGTLAVSDVTAQSQFNIYPNPAKDFVNVNVNENGNFAIQIYDMAGKVVFSQTSKQLSKNQTEKLDVSKLPAGIYLISLEGAKQSFSKKLVIK